MYICICNAVNEKMVQAAIVAGAKSVQDLQVATGLAADCGKCAVEAMRILRQHESENSSSRKDLDPHPKLVIVA